VGDKHLKGQIECALGDPQSKDCEEKWR
jgi:hypothetical protein